MNSGKVDDLNDEGVTDIVVHSFAYRQLANNQLQKNGTMDTDRHSETSLHGNYLETTAWYFHLLTIQAKVILSTTYFHSEDIVFLMKSRTNLHKIRLILRINNAMSY